jgi:hypothetical protein
LLTFSGSDIASYPHNDGRRRMPPPEPAEITEVLKLEAELAAAEADLVKLREKSDRFDGKGMKRAADEVQRLQAELGSRYGNTAPSVTK